VSPHPRDEDEPHGIAARPQRWLPLRVGVAVAALALAVLGRRAEGVMTRFRARDHVVAGRPGSERSLRSATAASEWST